jgi:hypothetical protein
MSHGNGAGADDTVVAFPQSAGAPSGGAIALARRVATLLPEICWQPRNQLELVGRCS